MQRQATSNSILQRVGQCGEEGRTAQFRASQERVLVAKTIFGQGDPNKHDEVTAFCGKEAVRERNSEHVRRRRS